MSLQNGAIFLKGCYKTLTYGQLSLPVQFLNTLARGMTYRKICWETKHHTVRRTDRVLEIVRAFIESDKVSIAAINGSAIGSSADLTLMCDIRVMGEPYYLRWSEAYLGVMPNWGASTLLPMLVGRSHALEWLLNGREIHTKELNEAGLLHGIHPPDEVLPAAQKIAEHVVQAHPASVKAIKSTVLHSFFMPLVYAFTADAKLSTELYGEPEYRARAEAFLDHRMTDYLSTKNLDSNSES